MARQPRRFRSPYGIQPKPRWRPPRRKAGQNAGGMDIYHLLSAAAGAFMGLVIFSLVTPTHLPDSRASVRPAHKSALTLAHVTGSRAEDGLFHVHGQIVNGGAETCKLASVTIRFFDRGGRLVTRTLATAEDIRSRSRKPFDARAHVPGAVSYEVAVDLAQF